MALLAESLVEEWLNRLGFFTIRGLKEGVSEIDLLAVRPKNGSLEAWHVEVQISFRPVGYLTDLPPVLQRKLNKSAGSAFTRNPELLRQCVRAWVHNKFDKPKKVSRRNELGPGLKWDRVLVHGNVREPLELSAIAEEGVRLVALTDVLRNLCSPRRPEFTCGAGGDIADLIDFFSRCQETQAAKAGATR